MLDIVKIFCASRGEQEETGSSTSQQDYMAQTEIESVELWLN